MALDFSDIFSNKEHKFIANYPIESSFKITQRVVFYVRGGTILRGHKAVLMLGLTVCDS